MLINIIIIVFSYLLGSVASAIVVCKLLGYPDPREHGSGNPGTTNILRLYGKPAALMTLFGDVLKGFLPVIIAKFLNVPETVIASCGLAAFIGHLYPVFFDFKGGKGVATLIGVLFGVNYLLGLSFIFTWLIIAVLFRYSSLAALVATILTPVYVWIMHPIPAYILCISVMASILIWKHKSNIKNLITGNESKIEKKKIP